MNLKLLIIEDASSDVELIVRHIQKAGFDVNYRQVDSEQALDTALAEGWDFIISDYNMPGLCGQKCLEKIRAVYPLVPFVLISGTVGEEVAVQMMRQGASDYLMKNNLYRLGTVVKKELTEAKERKERKMLDTAILTVSQAMMSAGANDFFEIVLCSLAKALHADETIISLYQPAQEQQQTLCRVKDGLLQQNFTYRLDESPCFEAIQKEFVIYTNGISSLFPQMPYLQQQGYQGYIGVRLSGLNGQCLGVLAVLYRKAIEHAEVIKQILLFYASRIAAEIERNMVDKALRQSEKRFASFFMNSPAAMCVVSRQTQAIVDVNDSFCRISGYTRQEAIGNTTASLNLYVDIKQREEHYLELAKFDRLDSKEFLYQDRYGKHIHGLTSVATVQINGEDCLMSTILDISEKVEAQQRQRAAETKLTAYFNSTSEVIFLLDIDYTILAFNKVAEETIFKFFEKNVQVGESMLDYAVPTTKADFMRSFQESLQGHTIKKEVLIPVNGQQMWWEITCMPIRNTEGEVCAVSFTSVNIDNTKTAAMELQQNEERFRAMVNNISDIITLLDTHGHVVYHSASITKILGYAEEDLIGQSVFNLLHPDDVAEVIATFTAFVENKGMSPVVEFRMLHKAGHYRYMEAQGSYQVNNTAIEAIVVVSRDVTDRKKAEAEMIKQSKHLAASNAELERFAYVASHDLQEPLRMVSSFVTLLEKKYRNTLDDTGKKYIDFAVEGASRMRQLILDLLMYSKLSNQQTNWQSIDLNELLVDTLHGIQLQILQSNSIIRHKVLPTIRGDRFKLQQLLQNLIINAIKYQPEKQQPIIDIDVDFADGYCRISVKDNGIGINARYFDKIFTVFQRLHNKDEYSGTGIGLSICKKLAENMGGKIGVKSIEGVGSEFYFTVPQHTKLELQIEEAGINSNEL
jgi:PAS domain S-box-containing protein